MQLNKQTDYALRVLIYLGIRQNDALVNIDDIVDKFHIPRNHLTKIITKLNKLNLIQTYRGVYGGMKLRQETLGLSLATIVGFFENTTHVIDCQHLSCPIAGMCRLKSVLDEASNNFMATLGKYTLGEMLPQDNVHLVRLLQKIG